MFATPESRVINSVSRSWRAANDNPHGGTHGKIIPWVGGIEFPKCVAIK
jgi:hypothetical protein